MGKYKKVLIIVVLILLGALAYKTVKIIFLPEVCRQKGSSSGDCFAFNLGYQYNKVSGKCEQTGGSGCDIYVPFQTKESCEKTCK